MKVFLLESANLKINCKIRKIKTAKKMTLSLRSGSEILLTIPRWVTYRTAVGFLREKEKWITHYAGKLKENGANSLLQLGTKEDYLQNREKARKFVVDRLEHFNSFYGFRYNRVAIRDQKSRWGSCSEQGNLNFNYRIIFLTAEQASYLIVHELCHLKELNHSKFFWALVKRTISDYKDISKELRTL